MLLLQGREMERKNEKEFYLFADNAYNEEEEPKIYAETGEEDVGSVSGADAGRAMNIFGSLSSATQTAAPCMFHAYRPTGSRHSVARGSCVWRQVSRPRAASDITIMVLQVRRRRDAAAPAKSLSDFRRARLPLD